MIIRKAYTRLDDISRVAILADPACRKGWEKNFPRLLKKVVKEHAPQLFLAAGDMALNAHKSQYIRILNYINYYNNKVWAAVPGDHDVPLKYFREYFGSLRKVVDVGKWRFLMLNTSNRMFLKKEAEFLDKNIRPNTIILSHLPPEAEGWTFHSLWPRSSDRFLSLVKKHRKKIKGMYFGHIHGFSKRKYMGIPMTVTGAVAESKTVKNNRYAGNGFLEMIIFDVKTGSVSVCKAG